MTYYVVPKDRLVELLERELRLYALECGGVDDWEWYSASIWDYIEKFKKHNITSLEDLARHSLTNYPTLEQFANFEFF